MGLKVKLVLVIGALLLKGFFVLGEAALPPVTLILNPRTGFEPFSTRGKVVIAKDPSNREWCLVWDSDTGESGLSCKPLEGEKAATTHPIELKELSKGEYVVKVILIRGGLSEIYSTPLHLLVIGAD